MLTLGPTGVGCIPTPSEVFSEFFLRPDRTSAPDVYSSCSFLHFSILKITTANWAHVNVRKSCSIKLVQLKPMYALYTVVCSQTLYFFFKVHRARVIKYRPQGIYWLPTQEGSGGGRRTFFSFLSRPPRSFSRAHSHAMFLKKTKRKIKHFGTNERKNKTTSVYRLIYRFSQG